VSDPLAVGSTGVVADVLNPSRRRPDIAKARRELQYNRVVPLDDGLRRSLIWYSENGS